ncbi:hypothetical protein TSAR_000328 [Trichomalopsis sarcophagae]|uniref:Uncharacterized protein n=1 Tax=Trichomalopsis sarcophagae TaxID=543379 RepID=A0A232EDZ0_9HYME|nr:hypothetical protein TSAR_000328 [Trichomalopsis sarcophagae]
MCAKFAKICLEGQPVFSEQRLLCTQEPHFFLNPKGMRLPWLDLPMICLRE